MPFAMPSSGYALFSTDGRSITVLDGEREVGRIEGSVPQTYYGSTTGFVLAREDGLFAARPGATELVRVERRTSSGLVAPGWVEGARCATNADQPRLVLCGREIELVASGAAPAVRVSAALERGRWIDAALSPDGAWIGANWQGECEVVWGFIASVRDGRPSALVSAEGEPAPSSFRKWLANGEAVGSWRTGDSCGGPDTTGVYRFLPGAPPRLGFTTTAAFAVW